jgi:transposase-like protein
MYCNRCGIEVDEKKVHLSPKAKYSLCKLCNEQLQDLLNETINTIIDNFIKNYLPY